MVMDGYRRSSSRIARVLTVTVSVDGGRWVCVTAEGGKAVLYSTGTSTRDEFDQTSHS